MESGRLIKASASEIALAVLDAELTWRFERAFGRLQLLWRDAKVVQVQSI